MATLTLDVLGMCVVLRQGTAGPWSIGFFNDPGHLQTVHYEDADGARVAALTFWGARDLAFTGTARGAVTLGGESRLPFMNDVGGNRFQAKTEADLKNEFRSIIALPSGTLTALPAHIGDEQSTWSFGGADFVLTDRLRFSAPFNGVLQLGTKALSSTDVHLTITSVDRDYGSRPQQKATAGFPLTEFAHFYRCTTEGGPIPRRVLGKTASKDSGTESVGLLLDPDSPICPLVAVQY
jgi:hypothetical protein